MAIIEMKCVFACDWCGKRGQNEPPELNPPGWNDQCCSERCLNHHSFAKCGAANAAQRASKEAYEAYEAYRLSVMVGEKD